MPLIGDKVKLTTFGGQEITGKVVKVLSPAGGVRVEPDRKWDHLGIRYINTRNVQKIDA